MSSTCKQIQDQIAGYVDREIEPAQVSAISRHLDDCPGCAEEASAQQKMKDLVREHAHSVPAPAHVRAEIRRLIDQHSSGFGFLILIRDLFQRQPVPALAAAVVLMLLSGVATYFVFQPQAGSDEQFVAGSIEGEIICVDCDLLDLIEASYVHDDAHRLGLRCKDGHIWSILRTDKYLELSNNFHRQVRIVGQLFQRGQYVEVKEFSLI